MTLGEKEPGWYQISLSAGQLAATFVVALVLLAGAFVFGFLSGRSGPSSGGPSPFGPASTASEEPTPLDESAPAEATPTAPTTVAEAPATEAVVGLGEVPLPGESASPVPEPVVTTAREETPKASEPEPSVSEEPKSAKPKPEKPATAAKKPATIAEKPASAKSAEKPAAPKSAEKSAEKAEKKPQSGGFTVQVGALAKKKDADALKARLARRYSADVVVSEIKRDGKSLWRVQVGRYADKATAEKMASRLKGAEKTLTAVHVVPR